MTAAELGCDLVVAKNRAHAGELVGCDHQPEPHSTNQDSSFRIAQAHLPGDFKAMSG